LALLLKAVGQDEDSVAFMAGSQLDAGEHAPYRIIPQRGQVRENVSNSGNKEAWDVFQEHVARSSIANMVKDSRPDPTVVLRAFLEAGG
jgi:hypothetical protein